MTHAIVIPLFNKADYVVNTLESLMLQTNLPDELIIVDDLSTDGSLAIAKSFLITNAAHFKHCRIEIIELPQNGGPGNARNVGLLSAHSELISFLDADDAYQPQLLERANAAFELHGLDFLVLNMMFMPGGEAYPDMDALKKYLMPLAVDLYQIKEPLRAVTSPHFIMGVGSNVITKRAWLASTRYTHDRLNEGVDFWYRVLKQIVSQSSGTIALLTGNHLHVTEVKGSLSRKTYKHFRDIGLPPVISRYKNSRDLHDWLLMGMIGTRWYPHAFQSLPSARQKLLFVVYYSYLLPLFAIYQLIRRLY